MSRFKVVFPSLLCIFMPLSPSFFSTSLTDLCFFFHAGFVLIHPSLCIILCLPLVDRLKQKPWSPSSVSCVAARKIVRRSCLGARPRYNLVVDEDVKKPTNQPTNQIPLVCCVKHSRSVPSLYTFFYIHLLFLLVCPFSAITSLLGFPSLFEP